MNKNYVIKRELFVLGKEDQIRQQYDFLKESGKGAYGKVYLVRLKTFPYHLRAVKAISKKNLRNPTQIINEIKVMGRLDHPHVVKLYETFEDAKNLFLVLEYIYQHVAIVQEGSSTIG
jgi:calcium-dependent protein kinase